jgi:hypothetical protein
MTPKQFIEKWKDNPLNERTSYQLHFIDLCALVGVPHPSPSNHETYCFERRATRTGAGQGWADVWKKGFFAFEYRATRRNLGEALKQLMTYALALDNPNGKPNSEVVRPLCNAMNITRRPSDTWIVDFGTDMSEAEAALYESPFAYVVEHVKPERDKNNREAYRKYWWCHGEARPGMRAALAPLKCFIATPAVSKHRLFVFLEPLCCRIRQHWQSPVPTTLLSAFSIRVFTNFGRYALAPALRIGHATRRPPPSRLFPSPKGWHPTSRQQITPIPLLPRLPPPHRS